MKIIDEALLNRVISEAEVNIRRRMNYNFHKTTDEPINRLLNAMFPDTYFPPHRHMNPDKQEIFLVLKGSVVTFLFDDQGIVTDIIEVNPLKGVYGMEIPPYRWHSFVVLEPGTVVYELKKGPYAPLSPENIAPWAPDSSDKEAIKEFVDKLIKLIPGIPPTP